jgi:hypothetical protein
MDENTVDTAPPTALVQKRWYFRFCWRGFSTSPISRHYSRRNGDIARHATIIPSTGGTVAVTPPFCAFGGVRVHATITDQICGITPANILFQAALACGHQISNEKSLHLDYD